MKLTEKEKTKLAKFLQFLRKRKAEYDEVNKDWIISNGNTYIHVSANELIDIFIKYLSA
ncbi:hypothetical protein UFOVP916_14 [uncultured Caudovirales phage]|uniref:Uncharacterized protein n=1 Tax=uncultured Caudovirales phage TaxID=2100421 RepID=A0A6J5SRX9_9CAUD|nr:hypothetical protein UFOVP827_35 [uncultured Caudovirales phage]CAB4171435.1 hypothetical protein UFOVP916_14 [uncultured Caudovirales phage]CAB4177395.1 hypothetical protein UFOVP1001_38 [uncultured Caudovirales phage]CAB4199356.1 hypothetical protein UFOVP1338_38 [uncultured Caudovirales phage]CAB4213452.1 hypothetical protein UFOVP1447_33 [uncultured Caudovirales phage]